MSSNSDIDNLIDLMAKLPGLGPRSARRAVLHLISNRALLLTPLSEAVVAHGGTIDKYMGDNIMAFWNAPLEDTDHALHACSAALDMTTRLKGLNDEREASGDIPLAIGVGVNTGECVVGNMGSDFRSDYTVLGDAVNLASRVEGASWLQIYTKVVMPLSGPVLATAAILKFLVMYNQYLWPLIVVQQESYRPVMVGLQYFFQLNTAWGEIMAYLTLITLPVLAFYLVLQRAFIASIASTGVKG